ncbi:uncharacterized protein LOC129590942 isoform X6 [Paramacrobiotus metropolitanus]|nr:uncharacterized protein LOC129590942 isoform X6 [Paramacrobiotus metropolitanus]
MDCRLVDPGFRRLWVGAEGISYQNTVAVRIYAGTDECWLGYIQDIRDEHVLVDFASSRPGAAARYIHASHVWPLPCLSPHPDRPYTSVFAALRDRYDEPFRFRPATALHFDWECKMCFINLSAAGADAAAAPGIGSGSGSNGKRVMAASAGITGAAEASLRRLPLALLTEILEDLDLHTQAHAIRVCALWRAILGDPGTTQHISVLTDSLHSTTTRCGDHSYCCRCAMLLSRVITPKTRSLSLIARGHDWPGEPFNWHILCYVQKLWKAMRLQLPFLVLKAFCLDYMHPEILLGFEDHCDQLIVDGLEMRGTLFNDMQTAVEGWPLPAHEMPFINEP